MPPAKPKEDTKRPWRGDSKAKGAEAPPGTIYRKHLLNFLSGVKKDIEDLVRKCTDERQAEYIRRLERMEALMSGPLQTLAHGDQNLEFDPELFTPRTKLFNVKQVSANPLAYASHY